MVGRRATDGQNGTAITWEQEPAHPPETHLVLGHDRHPASDPALAVAADLARRLRAQLHVVHGIDLSDYPVDPDAADWEEQAEAAVRAQLETVARGLAGTDTGWSYHAGRGDPVRLIGRIADDTDALMIIVGTRGEGLGTVLDRIVRRSVSHGLIAHAHRPVLVVPDPDEGHRTGPWRPTLVAPTTKESP